MKKFSIVLIMLLTIMLTGCGETTATPENKLENAFSLMDSADSYRMDMTMTGVPIFGTVTMVYKMDGDMIYSSSFLSEGNYSKMIDGEEYEYTLIDEVYVLSETPVESDSDDDSDLIDELDFKDFEEVDGIWVLIEDKIYLDEEETEYMTGVEITLTDDGYIELMTCTMYSDDYSFGVEVAFSGYNDTTVVLPSIS